MRWTAWRAVGIDAEVAQAAVASRRAERAHRRRSGCAPTGSSGSTTSGFAGDHEERDRGSMPPADRRSATTRAAARLAIAAREHDRRVGDEHRPRRGRCAARRREQQLDARRIGRASSSVERREHVAGSRRDRARGAEPALHDRAVGVDRERRAGEAGSLRVRQRRASAITLPPVRMQHDVDDAELGDELDRTPSPIGRSDRCGGSISTRSRGARASRRRDRSGCWRARSRRLRATMDDVRRLESHAGSSRRRLPREHPGDTDSAPFAPITTAICGSARRNRRCHRRHRLPCVARNHRDG